MPAKKKVWLIIGGLAGLAAVAIYFSLPGITTKFLVAQAEKFGLKNLQFKVIHVGWRRLDLADVSAGDKAAPALRIPQLTMEYSLAGLWQKKIKNVRLSGVWLKLEDRGQGFRFRGMIDPAPAPAPNSGMPVIERFTLENSNLRLAWAGRSLTIPIGATLRSAGPGYFFSALLLPLAETVRLQGTIAKDFTAAKMTFTVPGFSLPALVDLAGFASAARGQGRISAHGEIILEGGSFKTAAVSFSSPGDLQLAVPGQASVILDSFSLAFTLAAGLTVRDIVAGARGRQLLVGEIAAEAPSHWPSAAASGRTWSFPSATCRSSGRCRWRRSISPGKSPGPGRRRGSSALSACRMETGCWRRWDWQRLSHVLIPWTAISRAA